MTPPTVSVKTRFTSISSLSSGIARARQLLGLDRAVAFTMSARICSILSSVGTVLLMSRFLSPVEQGYYYTLLSLIFLQTVFELGFSFVIQQHAAHESAQCVLRLDGTYEGTCSAHRRLSSLFKLTVRWYFVAAIAIAIILLPTGIVFFSRKSTSSDVHWIGPWILTVLMSCMSFLVFPMYSFLEGCNQIREVAKARFWQSIVVLVMSWSTMAAHHGLYASATVNFGAVLVGAIFLWKRRRLLVALLKEEDRGDGISWRTEVWPFQWKMAISWLCSYFTVQLITPILFSTRGPVEAGRMGMSLNIVGYMPVIVLSWITTKATPFGQLVQQKEFLKLDRLFLDTLKRATAVLVIIAITCLVGVAVLPRISVKLAARMESPGIFAILLFAAASSFLVQSMAIYLRSFKREPFLFQSSLVAALSISTMLLAAPRWGDAGAASAYTLCTGCVGLISGIAVFRSKRRLYQIWSTAG